MLLNGAARTVMKEIPHLLHNDLRYSRAISADLGCRLESHPADWNLQRCVMLDKAISGRCSSHHMYSDKVRKESPEPDSRLAQGVRRIEGGSGAEAEGA